jgi:predicted hydrolase (HD superfamily)
VGSVLEAQRGRRHSVTKLEEAQWQIKRLKGLIRSGCLLPGEKEAKVYLLRQWEDVLKKLKEKEGGAAKCS